MNILGFTAIQASTPDQILSGRSWQPIIKWCSSWVTVKTIEHRRNQVMVVFRV